MIQKSRRGDLPKGDDTYSISLFSKIGDKVEVGVKNLKKIFVSFFPHISLYYDDMMVVPTILN